MPILHLYAAIGNHQDINQLLTTSNVDIKRINELSYLGDSALILACKRGCATTASLLCNHGVDPAIGTPRDITCLHWLFNFPEQDMAGVAALFCKNGANVNALITCEDILVNYHFPFSWPHGSPLHWAVATSSYKAVEVLLEMGANPYLRDGYDPYLQDMDIRSPVDCGNPAALGFSALDIASSNHDHAMLSLMHEKVMGISRCPLDVNQVDEDGYTLVHRLASNGITYTPGGAGFWSPIFEPREGVDSRNAIIKTIKILQKLGGNIDQLTQPSGFYNGGLGNFRLTPLMIAKVRARLDVVEALISCGADVNVKCDKGFDALSLKSLLRGTMKETCILIDEMLLAHGAESTTS